MAPVVVVNRHPAVGLAMGAALSVGAGQSTTNMVRPWAVAACVVAAVLCGLAGRRMLHTAPAVWIFLVAVVAALALGLSTDSGLDASLIALSVATGAPWFSGRYLRQQDELVDEAAQRARLQERSRIAQDMHDSLGHELSLLALRAGAIEVEPTVSAVQQIAASQLRSGAASAVAQLTNVIGVLRGDDPLEWEPPAADPEGLVRRAAEAGLDVTLNWCEPRDVPPSVGRCAHRVVQEGLTNATKHAPGSAVAVRIVTSTDVTQVTITNTAPTTTPVRPRGTRTGLVALRERLRSCGGTLDVGEREGGFEMMARIPHGDSP